MIKLYINGTDYSDHLDDGSLSITDQVQNKANTAFFKLKPGSYTAPEENQEVKIYDTVSLASASGTDIVVNDDTKSGLSILPGVDHGRGKYRKNQTFWLDIGGADEEKIVIDEIAASTTVGRVDITATESIVNSHGAGETCGRLIFAGTITYNNISNPKLLDDVQYQISCTDYTKIFDKKLVNDSWEDADSRYIINDFCNTTVNFTRQVDDMDYDDNAAVQAEWIESGDGTNPTLNSTDLVQGTSAVDFNWTNSGGTATFEATPAQADYSELTGANTGAPSEGNITLWYKRASDTGITSVAIRVGSDSSNYTTVTFVPDADTDLHFISLPLSQGTTTGTPDWENLDYTAIVVTETTSSSIMIDDLRMTAQGSFTLYGVEESIEFDDVRSSFKKPTVLINQLAKASGFYWYIDYEKDIRFFDRETTSAPFSVTDSSNNFEKLVVDIDTAQLKNRQVVRGGTKTSDTTYSQVLAGNGSQREWILKSPFENLTLALDDNSSTDTMEAGTTTTNVTATTHGLSDGDYIVNRTRDDAVRQITYVDADNFTVEAVTGQTNGDTFSKFDTAKTVGVEFLVDETTVDYVSNYNEKSIRATESEATLPEGYFLLATYNEIIPIRVLVTDYASIALMKTALGGDGIFDGSPITDKSLSTVQAARDRGRAETDQYANPIVKITFTTDHEGLESGQLLQVTDSNKGIDDEYLIQKVKSQYKVGDYPTFSVQAASTLFGIVEYFQKLSQGVEEKLIDTEEEIDLIVGEEVTITVTEAHSLSASESVTDSESITVGQADTVDTRDITTDPYTWQPDTNDFKWNLGEWG